MTTISEIIAVADEVAPVVEAVVPIIEEVVPAIEATVDAVFPAAALPAPVSSSDIPAAIAAATSTVPVIEKLVGDIEKLVGDVAPAAAGTVVTTPHYLTLIYDVSDILGDLMSLYTKAQSIHLDNLLPPIHLSPMLVSLVSLPEEYIKKLLDMGFPDIRILTTGSNTPAKTPATVPQSSGNKDAVISAPALPASSAVVSDRVHYFEISQFYDFVVTEGSFAYTSAIDYLLKATRPGYEPLNSAVTIEDAHSFLAGLEYLTTPVFVDKLAHSWKFIGLIEEIITYGKIYDDVTTKIVNNHLDHPGHSVITTAEGITHKLVPAIKGLEAKMHQLAHGKDPIVVYTVAGDAMHLMSFCAGKVSSSMAADFNSIADSLNEVAKAPVTAK